jgi:N-acetylglucosaminyldiphosphoundecaprenol N-acetyl-beta-D-mannosaminyltransferase
MKRRKIVAGCAAVLWYFGAARRKRPNELSRRHEQAAFAGAATSDAKAVEMFGVRIDALPLADVLGSIERTVETRGRLIVTYVNVHGMNIAYTVPWFRAFLNKCDIVFCDGFGVILGAKLLGYTIPERFTPPDWIDQLAAMAANRGYTLFLIGSLPGIAEKAEQKLKTQFPHIKIVGTHHGYADKTPGHPDNEAVVQKINAAQPDILIVGFGMPLQEKWLDNNWDRIDAHVALTVGALFDYMTGEVVRAPRVFTDNGFEWLGRLVIEPRRLWKRYLIGNPLYFLRIFVEVVGRATSSK